METVRSDAVCIPNKENVSAGIACIDLNQCSYEDHEDNWQHLEKYWGDEKHRVQQLETPLSSSLEKHLLYDDCLNKPSESYDNSYKDENNCIVGSDYVKGEDIKDIPTTYVLKGFQTHEFIVIGTYVDKRIIPGFKYRVRQNSLNRYYFEGKAQFLKQIGLGYGKRLTFASKYLNKNDNYFWSDSSHDGFAFSLEALTVGDKFFVVDCVTRSTVGYVVVSGIEEQTEIHLIVKNNGSIEKEVKVVFTCNANLEGKLGQVTISGIAVLVKEKTSHFAEIKSIILDSFIIENCELVPADTV